MSIIDIVEINGNLLAVSDRGQLIIWNLASKLVHGKFVFPNNVSLLPSQLTFQINPQSLREYHNVIPRILRYSKNTVYLTNINKLLLNAVQNKFKPQLQINCSTFLQSKESISCLSVVDAQTILLTTNMGNLLKYSLAEKIVHSKLDLGRKANNQESELLIFSTVHKHVAQITSLCLYSQNSLALVATSAGKIFSVVVSTLQIVYQLTSSLKQPLQFIHKLVLNEDKDKFYCLHESYVTLWSVQLNTCLQYYEYAHPQSVLKFKDQLVIAGPYSTLLYFNQICKQVALSMRSARTLAQIGESLIAVGGSECLIDIFQGEVRLMTLFKKL